MSKQKDRIAKISHLPEIILCEEEALRFFGLIAKSCDKISPPIIGESIKFNTSMSTKRSNREEGTTFKLSLGVDMSIIVLDGEVDDKVLGKNFADSLMRLVAKKVVVSINREMKKLEESIQKRKARGEF